MSVSVATAAGSSGAVASWPALRGVPAGAVGRVLAAFAPSASVIEVCSADDLAGPPTRNLPTRDLGPDDEVAGQGGETDLLVVEHGCRLAMGGFGPAAADRLAAGGLLAVLTHLDRRDDRTGDPAGSVVGAAQHADLLYLQHIIITTPIPASSPSGVGDAVDDAAGDRELESVCPDCHLRPAVVDLLLFAQPAAARPVVRAHLAPAVQAALDAIIQAVSAGAIPSGTPSAGVHGPECAHSNPSGLNRRGSSLGRTPGRRGGGAGPDAADHGQEVQS